MTDEPGEVRTEGPYEAGRTKRDWKVLSEGKVR